MWSAAQSGAQIGAENGEEKGERAVVVDAQEGEGGREGRSSWPERTELARDVSSHVCR